MRTVCSQDSHAGLEEFYMFFRRLRLIVIAAGAFILLYAGRNIN